MSEMDCITWSRLSSLLVPYAFSIPSRIEVSEATTGSMLNPVMNLMSSMANTFVGSTIAMVSDAPTRLRGRI